MAQNVTHHQQIGLLDVTSGGNAPTLRPGVPTASQGPILMAGTGAPTCSAPKGSLYLNITGSSVATRAYINTDGGTTWTAVTTVA